ncbi:hypothetical protein [Bradyrhizobium sp. 190]|nr:hypothetical protein [Bradyrhizobium sp. 190]
MPDVSSAGLVEGVAATRQPVDDIFGFQFLDVRPSAIEVLRQRHR